MNILNKISDYLFYLIVGLVILGGYVFEINSAKIEVGSVNAWAILLLIMTLIYKKRTDNFPDYTEKASNILFVNSYKRYKVFSIFLMISFFIAHTFKYLSFNVSGFDQAYVHNSLLKAFSSPILACDICSHGSYMGEHISPALMMVAPIMILFKSNILIYLLEVLIVFSTIFLLMKFILNDCKEIWFACLVLIFSHMAIKQSLIWDFREDHLTFLFLSLGFISLIRGNLLFWAISFLLTLLTKEHLPYFLPFLGFPIYFEDELKINKKKRLFLILIISISSIIWIFFIQKVITPFYNGGLPPTNHIVERFPGFGETNAEVVKNILFVPKYWWKLISERILTFEALRYTVLLYGPFVIFLRKRWWWILGTIPLYAMNLLSYKDTQRSLGFHYDLAILSLLIVGMLIQLKNNRRKSQMLFSILIALSLSGRWPNFYTFKYLPSINDLQDIHFFNNLDKSEEYLVDIRTSAYTVHHDDQKIFILKNNFLNFDDFVDGNKLYLPYVSALDFKNTKILIIDNNKNDQIKIKNLALSEGWVLSKKSNSGRFEVLRKIDD